MQGVRNGASTLASTGANMWLFIGWGLAFVLAGVCLWIGAKRGR